MLLDFKFLSNTLPFIKPEKLLLRLLPLLVGLGFPHLHGETKTKEEDKSNSAGESPYQNLTFKGHQGKIPYRLFLPEPLDESQKYPLVLFFHGAGERGTENTKILKWGLMPIHKYLTENGVKAIVIAPQCPPREQWVDTPWTEPSHTMPKEPSKNMKLAMELLEETIEKYPVDKNRIYVTGLSMGGFGVWDILQRQPELFAAGMPICGGGDTAEAKQLKEIPIWAFHGSADETVIPQRSKDMVDAIQAAGGNAKLSILPKGHGVWLFVYREKEYLDWLFEQKKEGNDAQGIGSLPP